MGPSFHHRRRARTLPVLAAVAVLTALFTAAATAAGGKPPSGSGGQPPCPSCPDRTPPVGGSQPSSGSGSGPAAVPAQPLFTLASITSGGNGTATVTGSVNLNAAASLSVGSVSANVQLDVNGENVGVSANGDFSATTDVAVNGGVTVQANDVSAGVSYAITIPSSAIPSSGVAASALVRLDEDKVTLMVPVDGFVSVDGNAVSASVHVAATIGIAGLSLNGVDLLARLNAGLSGSGSGSGNSGSGTSGSSSSGSKPGGGSPPASPPHSASAPVPGSAKHVKLTVTATNGASQTTTVRIERIRSVIRFGRLLSISAFGARGIRITKVVFNRTNVRRTGKLGVAVTVRDRRNYLVRDAVVMLQPYAHHATIRSSWARMSNALGRATFSVPVGSSTLGRRLYVRVIAQTPLARTHVTRSTYLPGVAR